MISFNLAYINICLLSSGDKMIIQESFSENIANAKELLAESSIHLNKAEKISKSNKRILLYWDKFGYYDLKIEKCNKNFAKHKEIVQKYDDLQKEYDYLFYYIKASNDFVEYCYDNFKLLLMLFKPYNLFYKYYTNQGLNLIERFILSIIPEELLKIKQ